MQIPVVRNVLEANEKLAQVVRDRVRGILTLNLISSPGAARPVSSSAPFPISKMNSTWL